MIVTRLTLDTKQFTKDLDALATRQLPFIRSLAINRLGDAFQKAERARLQDIFTLRRKDFILREGVKRLGPAATKADPTVTFGVSDRADFLKRFEKGERKVATKGAGHMLAIPQQVRRNKKDIITAANRPRALIARTKGVFVLRTKQGNIGPGVFQRTGRKGKGAIKFLYAFAQSVPTPASLHFLVTAQQVAETQWESIFNEAFAFAMRTAR